MAGTSDFHHIPGVLQVIQRLAPARMLDVGVGSGRWGVLCREVLELDERRVARAHWRTRLDGIEIFEGYRNPLWDYAYDQVHVGDAAAVLGQLGRYDLILCGDLIEHLDKTAGRRLLDQLLDHGDLVLLTSPRGPYPQGAICGNEHERHLSQWAPRDFRGIPHRDTVVGATFIAVLSRDPARIRALPWPHPLDGLGAKWVLAALPGYLLQRLGRKWGWPPGRG